jgi:hypothetical protein
MRRDTVMYNTLMYKYECFGVILVLNFLLTFPEMDQTRSASPTSCSSAPAFASQRGVATCKHVGKYTDIHVVEKGT